MAVGRIRELDGLRGMAILLVLLWHGLALPTDPETVWGRWVWKTLMLTWTGVDLFFVLSGFLIGGIILDQRHSENFFRVFYARRAYRILPPYLVLLAAYLVARGTRWVTDHPAVDLALFNDPLPFWSYVTFTQNLAMAFAGSLGAVWLSVTWSLAIEEQFYLAAPLVLSLLPTRHLAWVMGACVATAPALRVLLSDSPLTTFVMMPCRMDALLLGVLGAWMVRHASIRGWLARSVPKMYWALAVLAVGMLVLHQRVDRPLAASLIGVGYTWVALTYLCVLLIAIHEKTGPVSWIARIGSLRALGGISYSVYLFHQVVIVWVVTRWRPEQPYLQTPADATIILVALALTVLWATLLWHLLEKPLIARGHRFAYRTALPVNAGLPAG